MCPKATHADDGTPRRASFVTLILLVVGLSAVSEPPGLTAWRANPDILGRITVEAGSHRRQYTLASFQIPKDILARAGRLGLGLRDVEGAVHPLQVDASGTARFVLLSLGAGASATFHLVSLERTPDDTIRIFGEDVLILRDDLGEALRYQSSERRPPAPGVDSLYARGGYVHPIRAPSGKVLTDDFPPDHLHHHGLWAAWTNTGFQGRSPDFWNMGDGTGTVRPAGVTRSWSGPVHAGFVAQHVYVDTSGERPVEALHEDWTLRLYAVSHGDRPYRVFDLEIEQRTATRDTLYLPTYRYGGVGLRGRRDWLGADHTVFLTSEGRSRDDGHATRARWCHVGGYAEGEEAGITVLGHPDNFRAPQPMRIHPTEPFFNFAPSQAGHWHIAPDEPYRARYRFVAYDGPPRQAELERLWNDYANPPVVHVEHVP